MVNSTFETIWRDISPFAVGFDRTFGTLEVLANSRQTNYPPYNIRKCQKINTLSNLPWQDSKKKILM